MCFSASRKFAGDSCDTQTSEDENYHKLLLGKPGCCGFLRWSLLCLTKPNDQFEAKLGTRKCKYSTTIITIIILNTFNGNVCRSRHDFDLCSS